MPTYDWSQLTTRQQNYVRHIAEVKLGMWISKSQVAKYLDEFAAWDRGEITAQELMTRTGHDVTPMLTQVSKDRVP